MTYTITEKQFEEFAEKLCDRIEINSYVEGNGIVMEHDKAIANIKELFKEFTQQSQSLPIVQVGSIWNYCWAGSNQQETFNDWSYYYDRQQTKPKRNH